MTYTLIYKRGGKNRLKKIFQNFFHPKISTLIFFRSSQFTISISSCQQWCSRYSSKRKTCTRSLVPRWREDRWQNPVSSCVSGRRTDRACVNVCARGVLYTGFHRRLSRSRHLSSGARRSVASIGT